MAFDEIWLGLERQRPGLSDPSATVSITAAALKRMLQRVYDEGRQSGQASEKAKVRLNDVFKSFTGRDIP